MIDDYSKAMFKNSKLTACFTHWATSVVTKEMKTIICFYIVGLFWM